MSGPSEHDTRMTATRYGSAANTSAFEQIKNQCEDILSGYAVDHKKLSPLDQEALANHIESLADLFRSYAYRSPEMRGKTFSYFASSSEKFRSSLIDRFFGLRSKSALKGVVDIYIRELQSTLDAMRKEKKLVDQTSGIFINLLVSDPSSIPAVMEKYKPGVWAEYLHKTQKDYREILFNYKELVNQSYGSSPSTWRRYWHGTFYSGHFKRTGFGNNSEYAKYREFIRLVNSFALLDERSIDALLESVPELSHGSLDFKHLANQIYRLFNTIQDEQYQHLDGFLLSSDGSHQNASLILSKLRAAYFNHYIGVSEGSFDSFCRKVICFRENKEYDTLEKFISSFFKEHAAYLSNSKFMHDLKVLNRQFSDKQDKIDKKLKILKKDIHHFMEAIAGPCDLKRADKVNGEHHSSNEEIYFKRPYVDLGPEQGRRLPTAAKQQRRKKAAQNQRMAKVSSVITGVGEGGVAAYGVGLVGLGFGAIWSSVAIAFAVLVGIGGAYCNYDLLTGATEGTIDSMRTSNESSEKKPGSWFKKIAQYSLGIFSFTLIFGLSFSVGVDYSALSFGANTVLWNSLFGFIGLSGSAAATAGLSIAIPMAICTAICLTAIFYVSLNSVFGNVAGFKRSVLAYFKENYADLAWDKSPLKSFAFSLYNAFKLGLSLGVCAAVIAAGISVFYLFTAALLGSMPLGAVIAPIALTVAIGYGVVTLVFGGKSLIQLAEQVSLRNVAESVVFGIAFVPRLVGASFSFALGTLLTASFSGALTHAKATWTDSGKRLTQWIHANIAGATYVNLDDVSSGVKKTPSTRLQQVDQSTASQSLLLSSTAILLNGLSQATLTVIDGGLVLAKAFGSVVAGAAATFISSFGNSAGPNQVAAQDSVRASHVMTAEARFANSPLETSVLVTSRDDFTGEPVDTEDFTVNSTERWLRERQATSASISGSGQGMFRAPVANGGGELSPSSVGDLVNSSTTRVPQ